jgi:hypothetical protein
MHSKNRLNVRGWGRFGALSEAQSGAGSKIDMKKLLNLWEIHVIKPPHGKEMLERAE